MGEKKLTSILNRNKKQRFFEQAGSARFNQTGSRNVAENVLLIAVEVGGWLHPNGNKRQATHKSENPIFMLWYSLHDTLLTPAITLMKYA